MRRFLEILGAGMLAWWAVALMAVAVLHDWRTLGLGVTTVAVMVPAFLLMGLLSTWIARRIGAARVAT
jgi:hypothetical protein